MVPGFGVLAGFIWVVCGAYADDRKALKAGMLRPKKGLAIEIHCDSIRILYRNKIQKEFSEEQVTNTEYIRDNLFDAGPGICAALRIYEHESCLAHVPDKAKNFSDFLDWARKHQNHKVIEVALGD